MKTKSLFFVALMSTALLINAQTTIFNETFETATTPGLPVGWATQDLDGDANAWYTATNAALVNPMGYSETICISHTIGNVNGNNLLISPIINLPIGSSYTLTFLIGSFTAGGVYPANGHYAVYILPAVNTFTGTESPVLEETISTGDIAYAKSINLFSYAGQNIKIYFRHFNSPNTAVLLDNVKVTQSVLATSETVRDVNVGIYPNPATDYITVKSKSKLIHAEIYDSTGRKITADLKENKIDVKNLQSGNYIIKIETTEGIKTEKFIKK